MNTNKKIICHDLNNKEFEVEASKLIFRPSVYGVLIEYDKVLLFKKWDGYDLPGGGINIDETIEDALKREFFEETGLMIELLELVHCETSFFNPSHSEKYKNQYWNCPLMYFLVKKVGGEISTENFDEEEKNYANMAEWIELDKMKNLKFYNFINTVSIINKAIK